MTQTETRKEISLIRKESGVVIFLLDCAAKLNSLGSSTCDELMAALTAIERDPAAKAVVIMSGKADSFVIGADLVEIRKADTNEELYRISRRGQVSFDKIANMPVPVICAINGICFGGGLELALAAHWRIATAVPETQLGLPETRLGIIPGLGGTQRLPRLIGLKNALGMILSADPVSAETAKEVGLVDDLVAPADLMAFAERKALELAGQVGSGAEIDKRMKARREASSAGHAGVKATSYCLTDLNEEKATKLFAMTERSIRIKTKGNYPAQSRVLEVIKTGLWQGMDVGLELEASTFSELVRTDVTSNLMALFFATDFARQSAAGLVAKFPDCRVNTVGIVGGGIMGSGIAQMAAARGLDVLLRVNSQSLEATRERVESLMPKPKLDESDQTEEIRSRIKYVTEDAGLSGADIVIESVIEEIGAKSAVLQTVLANTKDECVIGSNTSSLSLAAMSESVGDCDRFLGLHFFYPVDKMPLVEVVSMKSTSRAALARAADCVSKLGKTPVIVKDGPGFLINRILARYLLAAARLAEEKVPFRWIEEAATSFGMPMGPLELMDEIGLDLSTRVCLSLNDAFGARMQTPEKLYESVRRLKLHGKKTCGGFYVWDESGRRKELNPALLQDFELELEPERCPEETLKELTDRLFLPMIDEAARCLEDKIVMKPREVDMAVALGIGFPPFRGGVLKYADQIGLKQLLVKLEDLHRKTSLTVPPSELIRKYAEQGRGFYSLGAGE